MSGEPANGGSLPTSWRIRHLSAFNARRPATINPASCADETFEYYSIPAYQEDQRPVLEKGGEIGSSKLLLKSRTVLFGKLNPRVEKVWRVGNYTSHRKVGSTEWLPLFPTDDVDEQFLYFLMWSEHVMPKAKTLVSGSTPSRQRVDPRSFYRIAVPLPPLSEQRRIAAVLGLVQRAIEQQERLIALTSELKGALLHKLFTEGLRGEPQKQTEIGPVPESWEITKLGRLANLQTGKLNSNAATPNGNFPFFTCSQETFRIDHYAFDTEAILLSGNNAQGIYSVKHYNGKFNAYQRTYVITIKTEGCMPYSFLYQALSRNLERLRGLSIGTSTKYLTLGVLQNLAIPKPEYEEAERIGEQLQVVKTKIANLARKRNVLTDLFRALLHQLMTAQIRVHDLEFSTEES